MKDYRGVLTTEEKSDLVLLAEAKLAAMPADERQRVEAFAERLVGRNVGRASALAALMQIMTWLNENLPEGQ